MKRSSSSRRQPKIVLMVSAVGVVALLVSLFLPRSAKTLTSRGDVLERTFVTYAYSDSGNGGVIDTYNLNYFIIVALSGATPGTSDPLGRVDYNIVVNGDHCEPCENTLPKVLSLERLRHRRPGWVNVLWRENTGMDLGAYGASVDWVQKYRPNEYAYFIFINSSSRGPFMPKWTPSGFHFSDVLTQSFVEDQKIKIVGSYLTCLPENLEPLPGPIIETTFFAVDKESLLWIKNCDIFLPRSLKNESAILGEYSVLRCIFRHGGQAEALSMRYAHGIDWRDTRHHKCNGNRHSSRRGNLEGQISPNLLEHVFVKSTWCVRAAESSVLSSWLVRLTEGQFGTEDELDVTGYLYGVSAEGTSQKTGTLRPDVPQDTCWIGDTQSMKVDSKMFESVGVKATRSRQHIFG